MTEEKYTLSKKIRDLKKNVTSVKHNLYCSGINSNYMYMFELSISHRQAVYKEAGR